MTLSPPALALLILPFLTAVPQQDCGPSAPETGGVTGCPSCWRSVLYPENWTPEFTDSEGKFLHDFSYAGYHNGELEPPDAPPGATFDVTTHGADASGVQDSTAGIQAAINAAQAAGGGVVWLPAGSYLCHGLLTVTGSGVVLRGAGPTSTKLVFTRSSSMTGQNHISFKGTPQLGAQLALAANGVSRSHVVRLADASSLSPGDDVQVGWTITDAFVERHEMTDTWVAFNGQWKQFFQRTITRIDMSATPHIVELDVPLRYAAFTSDGASLRKVTGYLQEVGIEDLGVTNAVAWSDAWDNDRASAIGMNFVKDAWVRNVHSFDSPWSDDDRNDHLMSCGILVLESKRVTVMDSNMSEAQNRGPKGNGYLFQVRSSCEVLFKDSVGRAGRHNFIQSYFGASGNVWLRTESHDGRAYKGTWDPVGITGCSDFHHSLSMANLIDDSVTDDCWAVENRNDWSTGAGLTATETVFWRLRGGGKVRSYNDGLGYVIGTDDISVKTSLNVIDPFINKDEHTEPEDYTEGIDLGSELRPLSLYESQRAKRLAP
ncbi:MAG: hypothetical protein ACI9MR_001699 [Myxococcota bacterium]|jgi:hypothetical protein